MAKRASKKSVSLTDPKPNADAAGSSSMNYEAKKRSTIKWFIAGALLLLMIFLGGGLLFLDHFPALRQFTLVEFFEQSFALKDTEGNTNLVASEKKVESEKENKEDSNKLSSNWSSSSVVGKLLAKRAIKKGIKQVIFDRGGNIYHGRVKALAEAAREEGLNF